MSQLILILNEEVKAGNLKPTSAKDYIYAINTAANRFFTNHQGQQEEVYKMTKSSIIFPSEKIEILEAKITEKDNTIATLKAKIVELETIYKN